MTRPMPPKRTPLRSYILRLVELREVRVRRVFELQPIGGGALRRFSTPQALQRFLASPGDDPAAAPSSDEPTPPGAPR